MVVLRSSAPIEPEGFRHRGSFTIGGLHKRGYAPAAANEAGSKAPRVGVEERDQGLTRRLPND
jgi:hypothetical protein